MSKVICGIRLDPLFKFKTWPFCLGTKLGHSVPSSYVMLFLECKSCFWTTQVELKEKTIFLRYIFKTFPEKSNILWIKLSSPFNIVVFVLNPLFTPMCIITLSLSSDIIILHNGSMVILHNGSKI